MAGEFRPGFKIDLHHKDMGIVADAARDAGAALPVAAWSPSWSPRSAQGYGASTTPRCYAGSRLSREAGGLRGWPRRRCP